MLQAFSIIGQIASQFLEGRLEKQKGDMRIKMAESEAKAKILTQEGDWEKVMAQGSLHSWKDEYLVGILSIPMILAFCGDWGRDIVTKGFEALETMPDYYQYSLGVVIASSFAIRGATKIFSKK